MKLTPKPSPKAKPKSRESTSTTPSGKGSSSTASPKVILDNVTYTGVGSQGQAVDTAYQKSKKKTEGTQSTVLVSASPTLSNDEKSELFNLGVMMAQMKWLTLYTDCMAFKAGVESGEGVINTVGSKDDFDGVVLYRAKIASLRGQPKMVEMNDPAHLFTFVGATATELYRRGILR